MLTDIKRVLSVGKITVIIKRICLSIVLMVVLGVFYIAGFPLPYLINNYRLDCFAEQLEKLPLPYETIKIGRAQKKFGNLGPCSKHGDYYVEYKIASTLNYSEIKKYYSQYYVLVPEINNKLFSMFRGLGTHGPIEVEVDKVKGASNQYLISALDFDYWHNDFRCW